MKVNKITRTITKEGVNRTVEIKNWMRNLDNCTMRTYKTNGEITSKEGIVENSKGMKRYNITYINNKPIKKSFYATNIPNTEIDYLI